MIAPLMILLACSGSTSTPNQAPATPGAPADLAPASLDAIGGEWFVLGDYQGKQVSRDWCESTRMSVMVTAAEIRFNGGQEESTSPVTNAKVDMGELSVLARVSDTPVTYRVRWTGADKKELIWEGAGADAWRLARKDALVAEGRWMNTCCGGPEGDMPTEVGVVPEGTACPKN